nr:chorismate-binding protein [Mycobacterium asiaticum]
MRTCAGIFNPLTNATPTVPTGCSAGAKPNQHRAFCRFCWGPPAGGDPLRTLQAMEVIEEVEKTRRGLYGGVVGTSTPLKRWLRG